MRLVPDDESGNLSATTATEPPAQGVLRQVFAHMRKTLAGPIGERFGPVPTTRGERQFEEWEDGQHGLQAAQYLTQFGGIKVDKNDKDEVEKLR